MNPNQKLFIRISHGTQVSEQAEVMTLDGALDLILESFAERKTPASRTIIMSIELSNQPITKSLFSREQQVEQELLAGAMSDPDEIIYPPDVTLRECEEAWASPEGQLMFKYQRGDNRMGTDPDTLAQIQSDYESKFPRIAPHGPKWTNT